MAQKERSDAARQVTKPGRAAISWLSMIGTTALFLFEAALVGLPNPLAVILLVWGAASLPIFCIFWLLFHCLEFRTPAGKMPNRFELARFACAWPAYVVIIAIATIASRMINKKPAGQLPTQ